MSKSPPTFVNRLSAEARYRDLRRLAFQQAQDDLVKSGVAATLRPIDAAALESFKAWEPRRVGWPWPGMAVDWRKAHPDRFELAVWSGGILCGLALGRPASTAGHLSPYYLEGNPDPGNPLHFKVAKVVIAALRAYALTIGKTELRLVDPLPEAIPFYCSPVMGFKLVIPRREARSCTRSI